MTSHGDAGALARALLYALAPVGGMVLGGVVAAWREPSGRVQSYIQHFAAGVVFAAVGVEVLPDVLREHRVLATVVGFAAGVVAMLCIRWLSRRAETSAGRAGRGVPWALVVAVAVDVFVDGMLIGVGFAAGRAQGTLLAIALTGCTLSLGLATAAALLRTGAARAAAAAITAALALLPALGAACGAVLAARLTGAAMTALLAFTCAALLYLVTEELLVEAHEAEEEPETALTTAVLFLGFLAVLTTDMLL